MILPNQNTKTDLSPVVLATTRANVHFHAKMNLGCAFLGAFQLVGRILIRHTGFKHAQSATGVARNALSKLQILINCERGCSICNSGDSEKSKC